MELKVWVEGIPRVVCGVSESTTCQDVVIALAHAIGKTGRYNLIEKWRETERLLAPTDNPIKSLHKWGEYAPDVQYVLRYTGDKSWPNRSKHKSATYGGGHNHFKPIHPEMLMRPAHCTNIKRNLTFSGAHSCSSSSPLRVPKAHGKSSSHDNSSLESLEEHSSFTSQSSTSLSPYASFEGHHMNTQPDVIGHSYSSIEHNRHLYSTQYSTSSAGSSPQDTPVNSLERRHKTKPSSLVHDNSSNQKDNIDDSSSRPYQDSGKHRISSEKHSPAKHKDTPKSESQSLADRTNLLHSNNNNNQSFMDSNELEYHKHTNWISSSASSSSASSSSPVNKPSTPLPNLFHNQPSRSIPSSDHNHVDKNHLPSANSILNQKHNQNESQISRSSPATKPTANHVDLSSNPPKKNKPQKGSSSSVLVGEVLRGKQFRQRLAEVDKEELLRLVNLQLERLQEQDSHMKLLQAEILQLEKKHESESADTSGPSLSFDNEIKQLEDADQELENHIQELELVSWEDKLKLETERQLKLNTELLAMHSKLSACEAELKDRKEQLDKLSEDVEKETAELAKKEQDTKNHEIKLKQEMGELREEIKKKLSEFEESTVEVARVEEELWWAEQVMEDRAVEEKHLDRELKNVNLVYFQVTPPVEMKTDVDKFAPYLTSATRPGSARKILYNPQALKEAISVNTADPCWV